MKRISTDDDDTSDGEYEAIDVRVPFNGVEQKHDEDNLYDLINTLGSASDISLAVSVRNKSGKYEFIDSYEVNEFDGVVDALREQYGAGTYRIRAKRRGERRPIWEKDYSFAPKLDLNKTKAVENGNLLQQLQQQNQILMQLLQRQQGQPVGNGVPVEDQEEKYLNRLMLYKKIFAGEQNNQQDPFEIFMKAMDVAKSLQPDTGSNSLDLMRDLIKGMTTVAQNHNKPKVAPKALPANQPTAATTESDDDTMKQYFKHLLKQARDGVEPIKVAHVISENLMDSEIYKIIENQSIVDDILKVEPDTESLRPWLNQLLGELNKIMYSE